MTPFTIYLIGIFAFGLAYHPIKESVSGPALVAIAIGYAISLRFLALRLGKTDAVGDSDTELE